MPLKNLIELNMEEEKFINDKGEEIKRRFYSFE